MSKKNTLFSEAIAEAKAIRETAFSNAKLALEESFAPQIQTMISHKLNEMEDTLDEEAESEDAILENDGLSLDQLLANLDALAEGEEGTIDENTEIVNEEEVSLEEEAEDDDEVGEITVDELKTIIQDVITALSGDAPAEEEEETETSEEDEDINLDEILSEEKDEKLQEVKDELKEAKTTINVLRTQLSEINLLNSKLLYVNKIFKAKSLTEAQKVQVVKAIDRAETVNESKNIFNTLLESISETRKPNSLKENLGRASKPAGVAQKPILQEGADEFVTRMQKLAGIKQ